MHRSHRWNSLFGGDLSGFGKASLAVGFDVQSVGQFDVGCSGHDAALMPNNEVEVRALAGKSQLL